MGSIIANTVILALDSYPEGSFSKYLDSINLVFAGIFFLEFLLKLLAFGFKGYFRDSSNMLDCIVVLATVVNILADKLITGSDDSSGNASFGTALRGFRVLSLFKLAKTWKRFNHLLKTMWRTLIDISTFTVVLFLFMFVFSILGMEIFAYKVRFNSANQVDLANGTPYNQNFDSFLWSMTTVFVLFTGDSWSYIWFSLYRSLDSARSSIFVFAIMIIGNRILLNLFLAILL